MQAEGTHNAENLMAAWLVGRAMKLLPAEMVPVLQTLRTGEHRCELVAEWEGVRFYNDSKATNVHALVSALRSMPPRSRQSGMFGSLPEGKARGWIIRRRLHGGGTGQGAWLIGASAAKFSRLEPFCALQFGGGFDRSYS